MLLRRHFCTPQCIRNFVFTANRLCNKRYMMWIKVELIFRNMYVYWGEKRKKYGWALRISVEFHVNIFYLVVERFRLRRKVRIFNKTKNYKTKQKTRNGANKFFFLKWIVGWSWIILWDFFSCNFHSHSPKKVPFHENKKKSTQVPLAHCKMRVVHQSSF